MNRSVLAGACGVVLLVSVVACSGGKKGAGEPIRSRSAAPAAGAPLQSQPMAHEFGPAHVELLALSRTTETMVTGRFRIVNDGAGTIDLSSTLSEETLPVPDAQSRMGESNSLSGAGLLDGRNGKWYLPLHSTAGRCVCSSLNGWIVKPGKSVEAYASFPAPPADVRRVTVTVPLTVPFQDVPIGEGPVGRLPHQRVDPARDRLREPRILPVKSVSDGEEESVDEDDRNRSVRLSADVLFALDKADLTPRATGILRRQARQIDASTGTKVTVDGHTDSSGNDAINQPLSERRARAVADRLKSLLTRPGVTFVSAGHGAGQPVASNSDDAGRRKNRRVTVVFTRPRPPAPPASSGAPFQRPPGGRASVVTRVRFPTSDARDLQAEVNGVHRDSAGLTTLVWTLRNTGKDTIKASGAFEIFLVLHGRHAPRRAFSTGGVLLVDRAAKTRYYPLETSDGRCLCSSLVNQAKATLRGGETATYAGVYRLPAVVTAVGVDIPWNARERGFAGVPQVPVR